MTFRSAALGLFTLVIPTLGTAGCDTHFNLNECEGAPAPPTDNDYLNFDQGTALVDGPEDDRLNPDGRLYLPARVLLTPSGEREYVSIGAPNGELPQVWIESRALNSDTLEAGDEFFVAVGYNVSGSGEGGPGRMRVTHATAIAIEGTFAGCVNLEDNIFGIDGPRRVVRGGFNATRDVAP